jgi:hypothetical protein
MTEYAIEVLDGFFPEEILQALIEKVESSEERKQEFRWTQAPEDAPPVIAAAAVFAAGRLDLQFNFAILKWYRASDDYQSLAYIVHRDPEELASIPLVLCTLKGEADLIYWQLNGAEERIRCRPNMVVLLDPRLEHQVTPPLGPDGERFLLFLGLDTSRLDLGAA